MTMTPEEYQDLLEQAQDVVLLATCLTSLNRELNNSEWDEFVEQVGKKVAGMITKEVNERFEQLEAQTMSGEGKG